MARDGLPLLLCVALFLGSPSPRADDRIANTLAVQGCRPSAGRARLLRAATPGSPSRYSKARSRTSTPIRTICHALRDAYRGLIKTLKLANKDEEAAIYLAADPSIPARPWSSVLHRCPWRQGRRQPRPKAEARGETRPSSPAARSTTFLPSPPSTPSAQNHRRYQEVHGLLDQADQFFKAEKYEQAGPLYARVHAVMPDAMRNTAEHGLTAGCTKSWND